MSASTCSVCLTFDFDTMSIWIGSYKSNNPSMISRGEFGTIGLDRVLKLLAEHDAKATFFVPGFTAWAFPDLVKRIVDEGHEVGHHGWIHENPATLELEAEREVMERGFEALDAAAGIRPVGYRSAAWDFSPNTIDLLLEYGLTYSSSCMANDFYPYYLRKGDRWSTTGPYEFGRLVDLVELPPSWGLDDFPPLEFVWGANTGLNPPRHVEELWREEFDFMVENCPGGVYNLTCHPQFIGRGSRVTMLGRLLDHFDAAGVAYRRLDETAALFRRANPLDEWAMANPHRAGATARAAAEPVA